MVRNRARYVLAIWLAAPAVAAAQVPSRLDPAGGLTVDQAVATGLENSPALKAAKAMVTAAESRRAQAALRANPSVSAMWREGIGGMDRMQDVSITLPLELFRRDARVALAGADVSVAEAEARGVLLAAEVEVRRTYGAALAAIRRVETARALETAARQTYELLAARAEEGASPPLDRDLARVDAGRMSMRVRLLEADAASSMVALKRALGMTDGGVLRLRAPLDAVVADPTLAALAADASAPDGRPDLQAATARVHARDRAIDEARSQGRWDAAISGGYARTRTGLPFRAFDASGSLTDIDATMQNVSVGAMVMVPLFNRNQGTIAAAAAERRAAEAEVETVRLAAREEAEAAAIELKAALDAADQYKVSLVPLARRNLDTVIARYDLGRGTLFDVLQARQQLLHVEDEYTDILRRAYDAFVSAIAARGGLTQ